MPQVFKLLDAATTTATSAPCELYPDRKTYQAVVTGTGSVSGTVEIEGSNDGTNFDVIGTLTLSGTGSGSDSFTSLDCYKFVRADLTAISGTGAAVTATVSF